VVKLSKNSMLKAVTKISVHYAGKNKKYQSLYIRIPNSVVNDSQFPFSPNETVMIEIDPESEALIIRKKEL